LSPNGRALGEQGQDVPEPLNAEDTDVDDIVDEDDFDEDFDDSEDEAILAKLESWGNACGAKNPDTMRIGFLNINGLRIKNKKKYEEKLNNILSLLNDKGFDLLGLAEVNTNWSKVHYPSRPQTILKNNLRHVRCISSHNTMHSRTMGAYQPGIHTCTTYTDAEP